MTKTQFKSHKDLPAIRFCMDCGKDMGKWQDRPNFTCPTCKSIYKNSTHPTNQCRKCAGPKKENFNGLCTKCWNKALSDNIRACIDMEVL